MKWLLLARIGVALIALGGWRWRAWTIRREQVSPDWLLDHERRVWGSGVDQVSLAWPINKVANEASQWNTHRLRKRG